MISLGGCCCAGAAAVRAASRIAEESRASKPHVSADRDSHSAGGSNASTHVTAAPPAKPSPVCLKVGPVHYCTCCCCPYW